MDGTVSSIIASLEDGLAVSDLKAHESALGLLSRVFPSQLDSESASAAAVHHICELLLSWIIDDSQIYQYARNQVLAASTQDRHKRSQNSDEPAATGGQAYLRQKSQLIFTHVRPWLQDLWQVDKSRYADILFEILARFSTESAQSSSMLLVPEDFGQDDLEEHTIMFADEIIRSFVKLIKADIVFDAYGLFIYKWFDEVLSTWSTLTHANDNNDPISFKSLNRLFESDFKSTASPAASLWHSHPQVQSESLPPKTFSSVSSYDIWSLLDASYLRDIEQVSILIKRLCVIAQSGIAIPLERIEVIYSKVAALDSPVEVAHELGRLLLTVACSKFSDPITLSNLCFSMLESYATKLHKLLPSYGQSQVKKRLLELNTLFATLLITFGIPESDLLSFKFLTKSELNNLNSNRRRQSIQLANNNYSQIFVPSSAIDILSKLVHAKWLNLRTLIVRFFYCLFVLSSDWIETDKIINENASSLCSSSYRIFEPCQADLTPIRSKLLVCIISKVPETFKKLVDLLCNMKLWEDRYSNLDTLFSILFEICNDDCSPHLYHVIMKFFGCLWDENEYVRAKADILVCSFQESHFKRLSKCLDACLVSATDDLSKTLEISKFAHQMRTRLPDWQVLTWDSILTALRDIETQMVSTSAHQTQTDKAWQAYIQIITLALTFIADGISIDQHQLVKLRVHTEFALGFRTISTAQRMNTGMTSTTVLETPHEDVILAIFSALQRTLDSYHKITWYRNDQSTIDELIGSIFVDLVADFVSRSQDLDRLSFLALRTVITNLFIIAYKHELEGESTSAAANEMVIDAIRRVTTFLTFPNVLVENKLLILDNAKAFLQRSDQFAMKILPHQMLACSEVIATCITLNPGDILHDEELFKQSQFFLRSACKSFAENGILGLLFKIGTGSKFANGKDFYDILSFVMQDNITFESQDGPKRLKDEAILDVLGKISNSRKEPLPHIVSGLPLYLEKTHGGPFSTRLLRQIESCLTSLCRVISDWRPRRVDINPLLAFFAFILEKTTPQESFNIHLTEFTRNAICRFSTSRESVDRLVKAMKASRHPPNSNSGEELKSSSKQFEYLPSIIENMLINLSCELLSRRFHLPSESIYTLISYLSERYTTVILDVNKKQTERNYRFAEDTVAFIPTVGTKQLHKVDMDILVSLGRIFFKCTKTDNICWDILHKWDKTVALRTLNLVLYSVVDDDLNGIEAEIGSARDITADLVASNLAIVFNSFQPNNQQYHQQLQEQQQQSQSQSQQNNNAIQQVDEPTMVDPTTTEIVAQIFVNIRLFYLVLKMVGTKTNINMYETSFWQAIWPSCEKVLKMGTSGDQILPNGSILWSYFCDLILFLARIRSKVPTMYASPLSLLLKSVQADGTIIENKLKRALQSMSEVPHRLEYANAKKNICEETFAAFKYRTYLGSSLSHSASGNWL